VKFLRRNYSLEEMLIFSGSLLKLVSRPDRILNYLKVKLSLMLHSEINRGLPLNLHIEPTARCNYRCVKCGRFLMEDDGNRSGKDRQSMSFDEFRLLMDDLGDTLVTLRLWHYGEPLLNPSLCRMISYAKGKGVIVAVSTNGSLLDEEMSRELVDSGLDYLIVSLDGASRNAYQKAHGVDTFEQVVDNLSALSRIKRRLGSSLPFLDLQFIILKSNEHEVDRVRRLAGRVGADKLTCKRLDENDVNYGIHEGVSSPADLLPSDPANKFELDEDGSSGACSVFWEGALIRHDGTVLPCVRDIHEEFVAGNVFQDEGGFTRIWNSHLFRELRRRAASGRSIGLCKDCTMRNNSAGDQIRSEKTRYRSMESEYPTTDHLPVGNKSP